MSFEVHCLCSRFASKPFADIHKVEGLRGMYIASQLKNNGTSTFQQVSMITFNKGGRWRYLTAPSRDSAGHDIRCSHFRMHVSLTDIFDAACQNQALLVIQYRIFFDSYRLAIHCRHTL